MCSGHNPFPPSRLCASATPRLLHLGHTPLLLQPPFPAMAAAAVPTCRVLTVAIGSGNPVKSNAVKESFTQAFPDAELLFSNFEVESGVSAQPMGDEETRRGAQNRARHAAEKFQAANAGSLPHFSVGLEGGCQEGPEDSSSGSKELLCCAWMAVLQCSSEGKEKEKWGTARTGSFALPKAVAELVRGGMELGHADDKVFGRVDSKKKDGAVGLLTKGLMDRAAYYSHAVLLALIPFISEEFY